MKLSEIALNIGGHLEGTDLEVSRLAAPESAKLGELVVVREAKYLEVAIASGAALVLDEASSCPSSVSRIRVADLKAVWPKVLGLFSNLDHWAEVGIHPTATVEAGASVDPSAAIGAYVLVRSGAKVAVNAVIAPYCYVGEDVEIGAGTVLEPRVTLYSQTLIGVNCRIGSGVVIGEIGFGFQDGQRLPHTGRVVLEDGVELGAGCVLQRSLVGETHIGAYSQIGDLTNIGHNVQIGKNVVMVGFGPIGGSTVVEDDVLIGGNFVLSDHVRVGKGAKILGGSGISRDVPPGQTWAGGIPSRPFREHWRRLAMLDWLVEVERKLRGLLRGNHSH